MTNRNKLITNVLAFQVGWFSCVLAAANNAPWLGITFGLLMYLTHLIFIRKGKDELLATVVIALIGSLWDSLLTSKGLFVFTSGTLVAGLVPLWIVVMWLLFAATLSTSMSWLRGRYDLAIILGAISGPLSYLAGQKMGAVSIPEQTTTIVVMMFGWAFLMPLSLFIRECFYPQAKSVEVVS